MSVTSVPWRCPGCGFAYSVPVGARPVLCPSCSNGHGPAAVPIDLQAEAKNPVPPHLRGPIPASSRNIPPRISGLAALRSPNGEADPFPSVPAALSRRQRRKVTEIRRKERRILREELEEARHVLELLRDSDRVRTWQEDVQRAEARVREAWANWKKNEDDRIDSLEKEALETSALGVAKK